LLYSTLFSLSLFYLHIRTELDPGLEILHADPLSIYISVALNNTRL